MKSEYISIKTLNYNYVSHKKATLFVKGEELPCFTFSMDSKSITLSLGKNDLLQKNEFCSIDMLYEDKILHLTGTINHYSDGLLYIDLDRKATKTQQRESFRVESNLPCSIESFGKGKIKNISAVGVFIGLDAPITSSLFYPDNFKLSFSLKSDKLSVNCAVVEQTDEFIRAKFINLDDVTKETIVQYCCKVDAQEFRASKKYK